MARETTHNSGSDRQIDRLVNFSDAVIAIAVTVLVLPLAEKAATAHVTSFHDLSTLFGQQFYVFLLSFVVICRFWEVHHDHFNTLKTFDTKLFWLNAGWLLSIVLIPFSSELIAQAKIDTVATTAVYIGNLALTTYFGVAIEWVLRHAPDLRDKRDVTKSESGEFYGLPSAISMTISFIIAFIDPSLAPWSLLLLAVSAYMSKFFAKLNRR